MTVLHSKLQPRNSYRLLELPTDLLKYVETEEEDKQLVLKASATSDVLVICTDSKTYKLRQMNQTNSLMLIRPSYDSDDESIEPSITAFGNVLNFLEPVEVEGKVDFATVPKYLGHDIEMVDSEGYILEAVEDLKARSAASDVEFYKAWFTNCGVEINNRAYLLDSKVINKVLSDILTSAVSAKLDFNNLSLRELSNAINGEEPVSVIESVLKRFAKMIDKCRYEYLIIFFGV